MRVSLSCGHEVNFTPAPAIGDIVPCQACGYEYSEVTVSRNRLHRNESYYVRCEENDYKKYYSHEAGTWARADAHVRRTGHRVRIYDNQSDELITVRSLDDLTRSQKNVIAL